MRNLPLAALVLLLAQAASAQQPAMRQVQTPGGWEFFDDKGLAFRLDKNQKTIFSRELQASQKEMNANRGNCTTIPETGRYNSEMLDFARCQVETQRAQLVASAASQGAEWPHLNRTADILGEMQREVNRSRGAAYISETDAAAFTTREIAARRELNLAYLEIAGRTAKQNAAVLKVDASKVLKEIDSVKMALQAADYAKRLDELSARMNALQADLQRLFAR
jgi:hypothetical protein